MKSLQDSLLMLVGSVERHKVMLNLDEEELLWGICWFSVSLL